MVQVANAEKPGVDEIVRHMKDAEVLSGSLTGTEEDQVLWLGVPAPPDALHSNGALDGKYRWYVSGRDWWWVKQVPTTDPPGTNRHVARNYQDRVLTYTEFEDPAGKRSFLSAHLDTDQRSSSIGPMLGRRWYLGSLAEAVREMTDVRISEEGEDLAIDGRYKGGDLHLTVVPKYDYLTTRFEIKNNIWRSGFTIDKVKRIAGVWMPERATRFGGEYPDGRLAKGMEAQIQFADFEPHARPTSAEVPHIPPGSMMGSEESRLYRVASDGTLVDFGMQGRKKPGASLGYGDLFVLSGAGILLTSLSIFVFRKRRSTASRG